MAVPSSAYLAVLVEHSVDAVFVDPPPHSSPVHLAVGEVAVETDVVVLVLQLVRDAGVQWDEDEEPPGPVAPAGSISEVGGAEPFNGPI